MSRTITGTIRHPYGTVWADAALIWTLLEQFKTAEAIYPEETFTINTGVDGTFLVELATPDSGTAHYKVKLPGETTHELNIDSGPSMDLTAVLIAAGGAVAVNEVQAMLDAARKLGSRDVSTSGPVLASDEYVRVSGAITLTLLAATGSRIPYTFYNAGLVDVTIAAGGTDLIWAASSVTLRPGCHLTVFDAAVGQWDPIGGG